MARSLAIQIAGIQNAAQRVVARREQGPRYGCGMGLVSNRFERRVFADAGLVAL